VETEVGQIGSYHDFWLETSGGNNTQRHLIAGKQVINIS